MARPTHTKSHSRSRSSNASSTAAPTSPSSPEYDSVDEFEREIERDLAKQKAELISQRAQRKKQRVPRTPTPPTPPPKAKKRAAVSDENDGSGKSDSDKGPHQDKAYKRRRKSAPQVLLETSWKNKRIINGKAFARSVDMWSSVDDVIDHGLARDPDDNETKHSDESQMYYRAYVGLASIWPNVEAELTNESTGLKEAIVNLLEEGRKAARQADTGVARRGLSGFYHFEPSIATLEKTERGYLDDQTGRLLTPSDMDWDNESHRSDLLAGMHTATDVFYNFMYEGYKAKPDALMDGLFRGKILVNVYRAIFMGPSAGIKGSSQSNASKAKRKSNAAIGGIRCVTIASIAYVTTLTRFSLSSDGAMTANSSGGFDYCAFYRELVSFLAPFNDADDDAGNVHEKFVEDLLGWWNKQIFPSSSANKKQATSGRGTAAKIKAQQRALALGEATNRGEIEEEE